MPALTIRMWFVGLLLCMTSTFVFLVFFLMYYCLITLNHCSSLNVFFNFRDPAPTVIPILQVLLLIFYPFGKFLAFILPITVYRIPLPYLPRSIFPLNQPSFKLHRSDSSFNSYSPSPTLVILNSLLTLVHGTSKNTS
jgi:hypothetical protein